MLEEVSKHLTAQELALGLSRTCSRLYDIDPPHMIMEPLLTRQPRHVSHFTPYC